MKDREKLSMDITFLKLKMNNPSVLTINNVSEGSMHTAMTDKDSSIDRDNKVPFTVALPVYNEEGILKHLHSLLTQACASVEDNYEILYINDGSRDGTGAILRQLDAEDRHVMANWYF